MPEQEELQKLPKPQDKQHEALEAAHGDQGAASINPSIIWPPVVIAIGMALILAVVYGVTKVPIAEAKKADKRDKLAQVMPKFDNDPLELEQPLSDEPAGKAGNIMLYTGTVPDGVSGYGVTSAVGTGYSGYFSVVFGLDIAGTITSVKILETLETPGLGSKASQPEFIDQFKGKRLDDFKFKVTKDGGDVDAITGATITSRAVCDAVEQGLEAFEEQQPAAEAEQPAEQQSAEQAGAAADESEEETAEAAGDAQEGQSQESGAEAEGQDG